MVNVHASPICKGVPDVLISPVLRPLPQCPSKCSPECLNVPVLCSWCLDVLVLCFAALNVISLWETQWSASMNVERHVHSHAKLVLKLQNILLMVIWEVSLTSGDENGRATMRHSGLSDDFICGDSSSVCLDCLEDKTDCRREGGGSRRRNSGNWLQNKKRRKKKRVREKRKGCRSIRRRKNRKKHMC